MAPISASCDDSEDTTDHLGSPLPIHGSMISEDDEDDDVVISSASKRRRIVPKIDDDSALELSSDEDTLPEKTIELTLPEKIEKAVQTRFGMKRWCNFGDRLLVEREPAVRLPIATSAVLDQTLTPQEIDHFRRQYVKLGPLQRADD